LALGAVEDIPPLRPPKPELTPGFWDQHGGWIALGAAILLLLLVLLVRVLTRKKPPRPVPPAVAARQALQPLCDREEDAALMARVSSVLRSYLIAAFGLAPEELTNSELCRTLEDHPGAAPEFTQAATRLLEGMDHCRFDPQSESEGEGRVVQRALELIDLAEDRLQPRCTPEPTPPDA
jgi:hypothetical protein